MALPSTPSRRPAPLPAARVRAHSAPKASGPPLSRTAVLPHPSVAVPAAVTVAPSKAPPTPTHEAPPGPSQSQSLNHQASPPGSGGGSSFVLVNSDPGGARGRSEQVPRYRLDRDDTPVNRYRDDFPDDTVNVGSRSRSPGGESPIPSAQYFDMHSNASASPTPSISSQSSRRGPRAGIRRAGTPGRRMPAPPAPLPPAADACKRQRLRSKTRPAVADARPLERFGRADANACQHGLR